MRYFVVGGGTAGWLTALYVNKHFPYANVTVVASSELGILGAGEGTTPPFMEFLKEIDISPTEIIRNAKGTIKTGIKFTNWLNTGNITSIILRLMNFKEILHYTSKVINHILNTRNVKFEEIERIKNRSGDDIMICAQHSWSSISKGIRFENN